MKRIGLFPGTFDPVTLGHLDILGRALHLFDRMIVAVGQRQQKETLFTMEERMEMVRSALRPEQRALVEIDEFHGLLVDYARRRHVSGIVRGLRFIADFEYEFQMALMNQKLCPELDTIFLMPTEQYSVLNSSLVKEVVRNGGSVAGLVTPNVQRLLQERFARIGNEAGMPRARKRGTPVGKVRAEGKKEGRK